MTHDEVIERVVERCRAIQPRHVGNAFVASLATRDLEQRPALSAYAALRHLSPHEFSQSPIFAGGTVGSCSICGLKAPPNAHAIGAKSFGPGYYPTGSLPTLEGFDARDVPETPDPSALRELLDRLQERPRTTKLGELEKILRGPIKSNKRERQAIVSTFAIIGVLSIPGTVSYRHRWIDYDTRESVMPKHFYAKDSPHPLRHFTADAFIDEEAVRFWFGPC